MNPDDFKKHIQALPRSMSKGQRALEALGLYRSARLTVPDDVLREIENCYRHFVAGKPVASRPDQERIKPAPLTLGEAFGVPDRKGGEKSAIKRKRLALATPALVALFSGQGGEHLPRTDEGYSEAAKRLHLTASEVEDWVLKHLAAKRRTVPPP